MAAPTVTATTSTIYAWLGARLTSPDPDHDWALLRLIEALVGPLAAVETATRAVDGRPGWAQVLDPDTCPPEQLCYLAQFAGVHVPADTPEQTARARIKDRPGTRRGTPGAIIAAAREHLTGTKTVVLIERDTSAYHFDVQVQQNELLTDEQAVHDAIAHPAVKPVGLQFTVTVIRGPRWSEVNGTTTWADVDPTLTWADVANLNPGEL